MAIETPQGGMVPSRRRMIETTILQQQAEDQAAEAKVKLAQLKREQAKQGARDKFMQEEGLDPNMPSDLVDLIAMQMAFNPPQAQELAGPMPGIPGQGGPMRTPFATEDPEMGDLISSLVRQKMTGMTGLQEAGIPAAKAEGDILGGVANMFGGEGDAAPQGMGSPADQFRGMDPAKRAITAKTLGVKPGDLFAQTKNITLERDGENWAVPQRMDTREVDWDLAVKLPPDVESIDQIQPDGSTIKVPVYKSGSKAGQVFDPSGGEQFTQPKYLTATEAKDYYQVQEDGSIRYGLPGATRAEMDAAGFRFGKPATISGEIGKVISGAQVGMAAVDELQSRIKNPDGTYNREEMFKMGPTGPLFGGGPAIPGTSGVQSKALRTESLENLIRSESGAAINQDEFGRLWTRFPLNYTMSDADLDLTLDRLRAVYTAKVTVLDPQGLTGWQKDNAIYGTKDGKRVAIVIGDEKLWQDANAPTAQDFANVPEGKGLEDDAGNIWIMQDGKIQMMR